ncbi:MAG: MFS transporter [Chloroflexota bacterium]
MSRLHVRLPRGALSQQEVALYLLAFFMQLGMGIMAPVLPEIKETFGVSTAEVALTISAFNFARVVLDLPMGLLLDRFRPFVLLLIGTSIIAAGGVLGSVAPTFALIIGARALLGAGSAICMMTGQYSLSKFTTRNNRGRLFGNWGASLLAGSSLSPVIGGVIAALVGWRASFAFTACAAFLAFASVAITQRRASGLPSETAKAKQDAPKAPRPVTRQSLVAFILMDLVTFTFFFQISGFQNTVAPLIGGVVLGLDAAFIGLAFTFATGLRFGVAVVGGRISDRYGRLFVLVPGLVVMGFGILAFNYANSPLTYVAVLMLMASGRTGNSVPTTVLVDHLPARLWGRAMGINRFIGDLGGMIGPLALGWIIDSRGYADSVLVTACLVWATGLMVVLFVREAPRARPVAQPEADREPAVPGTG